MQNKNLIASTVINLFIFVAGIAVIISYFFGNLSPEVDTPVQKFNFFTTDSNLLAALASLSVGIGNILILKGKLDRLPHAIMVFKLMGVVSLLLTCITVMVLLIPIYGAKMQLGGTAFHMHLGAPLLSLISFVFLDGFGKIKLRNALWGPLPMMIYGAVYLWQVVVIGFKNGGWFDFYALNQNGKWYLSLIIMTSGTLALSIITLLLHNIFIKKSNKTNKSSDSLEK